MGNYTHMQNKDGKTIKVTGVKKDGQMYFKGADGKTYSVPKKMFLDYYNSGDIKIGNVDDKGNFVEYNPINIGTAEKAAKLMFAPYGTMAKEVSGRTVAQDIGNFFGGGILNWAADKFIPSNNSKMETSLADGLLNTGLGFLGYKAFPKAAHRKVPVLDAAFGDRELKEQIQNNLTKKEAYAATHPKERIASQEEQYKHNRRVANSVYYKNPVFNKKVPKPLDDEFRWNTEGRPTSKVVKEGSGNRSSIGGSDKDVVSNKTKEGSQQGGGTENIHTEIRGQQPNRKRDLSELFGVKDKEAPKDALGVNTEKVYNNFEDILNDAERVQSGQQPSDFNIDDLIGDLTGGDKKVANDELGIQKTINTKKDFNKGSQSTGKENATVKEHTQKSTDVNTNKVDEETSYNLTPVLEDAEEHTATDTRADLKDLYLNNSAEAKRIKRAQTLNELNDIVTDVRKKVNNGDIDRWEQAMIDRITALVAAKGEVSQAQIQRAEKLKLLDQIKISGDPAKLNSKISIQRIPRIKGTVADFIESYGNSQLPKTRYTIGGIPFLGKQAIPVLRNKDDEMFNAGRPSGDDVFEEIRASMNKKPGLGYVDPNPNKKKAKK